MKNLGPGFLIAAAFIGPGTVTTCILAGNQFGTQLLWALLFSLLATVVLQEMSARLGLVTGLGLSEALRSSLKSPILKKALLGLVAFSILLGNTAYEAGNLGGATLGLEVLLGTEWSKAYPLAVGLGAFGVLWWGKLRYLEYIFMALVALMSVCFITTAVMVQPDIFAVLRGLFVPHLPKGGLFYVIALIGTTVVPYNLFLHASLVKEKWSTPKNLRQVRVDMGISLLLGGMISMAILLSASAMGGTEINNALDLAQSLEPLLGTVAKVAISLGLIAAGFTSAMTAPLAAAYVAQGCFGWTTDTQSFPFRAVWIAVLFLGVLALSFSFRPIQIIQIAQFANGLLLPLIAIVLVWGMNQASLLEGYKNSQLQNLLGVLIILITLLLGGRSILGVLGIWG